MKYLVTLTAEERRDLSAPMAVSPEALILSVAHSGFGLNCRSSKRWHDPDFREMRP